jgi:hypothetical protein
VITERTNAVEDARAAYSRLLLRFAEDHPLPSAYLTSTTAFDTYLFQLRGYNEGEEYGMDRPGEIGLAHAGALAKEGEFSSGLVLKSNGRSRTNPPLTPTSFPRHP